MRHRNFHFHCCVLVLFGWVAVARADPSGNPVRANIAWQIALERVGFSPAGVDRMQIWEMLHATPAERFAAIETLSRGMEILRRARAAARGE